MEAKQFFILSDLEQFKKIPKETNCIYLSTTYTLPTETVPLQVVFSYDVNNNELSYVSLPFAFIIPDEINKVIINNLKIAGFTEITLTNAGKELRQLSVVNTYTGDFFNNAGRKLFSITDALKKLKLPKEYQKEIEKYEEQLALMNELSTHLIKPING